MNTHTAKSERIENEMRELAKRRQTIERAQADVIDMLDAEELDLLRRWWMAQPIVACEVLDRGCRKWRPIDLHVAGVRYGYNPAYYLLGWTDMDNEGSYLLRAGVPIHRRHVERRDLWRAGPHYRLSDGVTVTNERTPPW